MKQYFLILFVCCVKNSLLHSMTEKQRWERLAYKEQEIYCKNLNLQALTASKKIYLKNFGFPKDFLQQLDNEICYSEGDFVISSSLVLIPQNSHNSLLHYLCCLPQTTNTYRQEIKVLDTKSDTRSYNEKLFSLNFDRRSLPHNANIEETRDLSQTFEKINNITFNVGDHKVSTHNNPQSGIIVALVLEEKKKNVIVFGFRPFKPLCCLVRDTTDKSKLFISDTGDTITYINYDTNCVKVFKLDRPYITTRHYHDLFVRFK